MPGPTLAPFLRGQRMRFDAVYSETDSIAGKLGSRGASIAVTTPQHKLVEYTEEGSDEAYDVQRDPQEQRILPPEHDAYEKRQTLRSWHLAQGPLPPPSTSTRLAKAAPAEPPATEAPGAKTDSKSRADLIRSRAKQARAGDPDEDADRKTARNSPPRDASATPQTARAAGSEDEDAQEEEIPAELREHLRSLGYVE